MTQWIHSRSVGQLLSYTAIALALLALSVFYIVQISSPRPVTATTPSNGPILEIHNSTLTYYLRGGPFRSLKVEKAKPSSARLGYLVSSRCEP